MVDYIFLGVCVTCALRYSVHESVLFMLLFANDTIPMKFVWLDKHLKCVLFEYYLVFVCFKFPAYYCLQ